MKIFWIITIIVNTWSIADYVSSYKSSGDLNSIVAFPVIILIMAIVLLLNED